MYFKAVSFYTVALAATSAQAMMSANELVGWLGVMTEVSNEIIRASETIDASTVEEMMPKLSNDFSKLIQQSMETVANLSNMEHKPDLFTETEQGLICDSLKTSVDVTTDVVTSIVGEDPVLGSNPFAQDVVRILQVVEKVVESAATGTLELVPDCRGDVEKRVDTLRETLRKGASKFEVKAESMDTDMNMESADM